MTNFCCQQHTSYPLSSNKAQLLPQLGQTLPVQPQMVHSLGFEGQVISLMPVRLFHCHAKAAIVSTKTDGHGRVPVTLIYKSKQPCTSPTLLQFDTIPV